MDDVTKTRRIAALKDAQVPLARKLEDLLEFWQEASGSAKVHGMLILVNLEDKGGELRPEGYLVLDSMGGHPDARMAMLEAAAEQTVMPAENTWDAMIDGKPQAPPVATL